MKGKWKNINTNGKGKAKKKCMEMQKQDNKIFTLSLLPLGGVFKGLFEYLQLPVGKKRISIVTPCPFPPLPHFMVSAAKI